MCAHRLGDSGMCHSAPRLPCTACAAAGMLTLLIVWCMHGGLMCASRSMLRTQCQEWGAQEAAGGAAPSVCNGMQ
jgi:hypothetical protein